MRKPAEPEIHAYIDDLCKRGFYGELTLYFQNGDINSYRETCRAGKNELVDRYHSDTPPQDSRTKRLIVVAAKER
jgi:hypothetical protein